VATAHRGIFRRASVSGAPHLHISASQRCRDRGDRDVWADYNRLLSSANPFSRVKASSSTPHAGRGPTGIYVMKGIR